MTVGEFIKKYGVACGGNWGAMIMTAIKNGAPELYDSLDDNKEYDMIELFDLIEEYLKEGGR